MRPLRVLLADDDPSNREVATIMLRTGGHAVTACADGPQVLARCQAAPDDFDVVMLDIMMPGLDGLTVARRLRDDPRTREIPIVCVSAHARVSDREAGLEAGCDFYLTKPFNRRKLLTLLAEIRPR